MRKHSPFSRRSIAVGLAAGVLFGASGCGGDKAPSAPAPRSAPASGSDHASTGSGGSEPLSKQEYGRQVIVIGKQFLIQFQSLRSLSAIRDLDQRAAALGERTPELAKLVDRLETIVPPTAIAATHQKYVSKLREVLSDLEALKQGLTARSRNQIQAAARELKSDASDVEQVGNRIDAFLGDTASSGSRGSEPLSRQEYGKQVTIVGKQFVARFQGLRTVSAIRDPDRRAAALGESTTGFSSLADRLETIVPPPAIAGAHRELVGKLREIVSDLEALKQGLTARSQDQIQAAAGEYKRDAHGFQRVARRIDAYLK